MANIGQLLLTFASILKRGREKTIPRDYYKKYIPDYTTETAYLFDNPTPSNVDAIYKKIIDKNKNEIKTLWNYVKDITSQNKNNSNDIKEIHVNNQIITNTAQIATEFNKHYSEIGERVANKIEKIKFSTPLKSIKESIFLTGTHIQEIIDIINELKPKKASGIDGITSDVLKEVSEYVALPITYIINLILTTGKVPTQFKTSIIKPLFKKGTKTNIANYRPIALITHTTKIFEKILNKRIN